MTSIHFFCPKLGGKLAGKSKIVSNIAAKHIRLIYDDFIREFMPVLNKCISFTMQTIADSMNFCTIADKYGCPVNR